MRIWTFKTQEQLDKLNKDKSLSGDYSFIKNEWDHFIPAYNWIKKFIPHQEADGYPIWAWTAKPKLNISRFQGYRKSRQYLVELEVNPEDCLVSCFSLWHCVLNDMVVCRFDNEKIYEHYQQLKNINPERYEQLKERSWQRIFDTRFIEPSKYLQVCIAEIKLDQVISVKQLT